MADRSTLPSIREIIARDQLTARRSLGQNFLADPGLTARIVQAAGDVTSSDVLEIGAGPGGLTRALLDAGVRRLLAVEIDRRFAPALTELAATAPDRLSLHWGDGLKLNQFDLDPPVKIIANLPYRTGSVFLAQWLGSEIWPPQWSSLTVMLQQEVAHRITAAPGGRDYGRLTILSQWRTRPSIVMHLRPGAFIPTPKVHSCLVHFALRPAPLVQVAAPDLLAVVKLAFSQRRKMLRSSLRPLDSDIIALLTEAGIDSARRAETLSIAEFGTIAQTWRRRRPDRDS